MAQSLTEISVDSTLIVLSIDPLIQNVRDNNIQGDMLKLFVYFKQKSKHKYYKM